MMDTNIGILQYVKSGEISIENELSNIKADRDINIKIKQFFMNSPDYQKLFKEIEKKQNQLKEEENESYRFHLFEEINNLQKMEKEFQVDILHLANIFSKLEIRTERLRKARNLFNQGKFIKADAFLIESDLSNDQFNLLLQVDYLEYIQRKAYKHK